MIFNNLSRSSKVGIFILFLLFLSGVALVIYGFVVKEDFALVRIGSNNYKIHEDLDNPRLAAETMDNLNRIAKKLIYRLNDKYIDNQHGYNSIKPEYREIVIGSIKRLTSRFKTANMEENIPERSGGDTSYVVDKGSTFAMCVRDPKNNNKIEAGEKINELTFVLIHEMSHLAYNGWGHDNGFWTIFRFLLQEAADIDLYIPVNYKKNKMPYCGIVISYSPLYDSELIEYVNRN
jgi:hypothetical protein